MLTLFTFQYKKPELESVEFSMLKKFKDILKLEETFEMFNI